MNIYDSRKDLKGFGVSGKLETMENSSICKSLFGGKNANDTKMRYQQQEQLEGTWRGDDVCEDWTFGRTIIDFKSNHFMEDDE